MKYVWVVSFIALTAVSCVGTIDPAPLEPEMPALPEGQEEITEIVFEELTEVADTETPLPSPEIIPTNTSPSVTQPEPAAPAAIIARTEDWMSSFILVGGSLDGSWVGNGELASVLAADKTYQLYSANQSLGDRQGETLEHEPICGQPFVNLGVWDAAQRAVGIAGNWSALPRAPQELTTDAEGYLEAVASWLVDQAPSQPVVVIDKIWRVDIEGDGTDEVFINATRFSEPTGHSVEPGDYSVILMRTVIGNEVVTVKLVGDYYADPVEIQFPLTYSLEFIGDLNGDGSLEVVVGVSRWEGMGVLVFEIDHDQVEQVLSVMCSQ